VVLVVGGTVVEVGGTVVEVLVDEVLVLDVVDVEPLDADPFGVCGTLPTRVLVPVTTWIEVGPSPSDTSRVTGPRR